MTSNRRITELYHLAEERNLPSIMRHGLLSAERLFVLANVPRAMRTAALREHRDACAIVGEALIRDQKPMPPALLGRALENDFEPADWYALVNRHVFLWPNRARLAAYRRAYAARPQTLLVFDAERVLADCLERTRVSPINSGNARRRAAPRGPNTWLSYADWVACGWPGRRGRPVEVLVEDFVPTSAPYLKDVLPG